MKVGDLVCLKDKLHYTGLVIKIMPQPQDNLNDLFPYLIYFADGHADFFGDRHLGAISEGR